MNTMRSMTGLLLLALAACMPVRDPGPVDASAPLAELTATAFVALDEPLTSARALQIALARHPDVRAEMARLDAVEAERVQAGLLRNPMLSLMALRPEGGGRLAIEAGWMQSLFDLLTRSRRVARADARARRERAEVALRLLDVGWQAQRAFHEAVAAHARVRLLQSELVLDQQALDLQARWTRQGLSSQAEWLRWQALRDERRHLLDEAGIEAIMAQSTLAMRLGLDSRQALRLPDEIERPQLSDEALADGRARALRMRPELKASAAAIDLAARDRVLDTGTLRAIEPELGVRGERDADGMTMAGAELRVAWPWFDRGQARGARRDAMQREATWRDEAQRRQVLLEVETALSVLSHAARVVAGSERHLLRARAADALAARRHRNGGIDLMTRIEAQRDVLVAERQCLDARSALARAHVDMQQAVGAPGAGG